MSKACSFLHVELGVESLPLEVQVLQSIGGVGVQLRKTYCACVNIQTVASWIQ